MIIFLRNEVKDIHAETLCHAIANVCRVETFVDRVEFTSNGDSEEIVVVNSDCYERHGIQYDFLSVYESSAEKNLREEFPGCTWE